MVWHSQHRLLNGARARGMTLIEVSATLVVLAITGVAISKWVGIQARLDRQTEHRVAASLAAQNAIERLRDTGYADLEDAIVNLRNDASVEGLRFVTSAFSVDSATGVHLRVDATDSSDPTIILASEHLWRIESTTPEPADAEPASEVEPQGASDERE